MGEWDGASTLNTQVLTAFQQVGPCPGIPVRRVPRAQVLKEFPLRDRCLAFRLGTHLRNIFRVGHRSYRLNGFDGRWVKADWVRCVVSVECEVCILESASLRVACSFPLVRISAHAINLGCNSAPRRNPRAHLRVERLARFPLRR